MAARLSLYHDCEVAVHMGVNRIEIVPHSVVYCSAHLKWWGRCQVVESTDRCHPHTLRLAFFCTENEYVSGYLMRPHCLFV